MDKKGPIDYVSGENLYFHIIVDHFSKHVLAVPTPENNADFAVNANFLYWFSKFGLPHSLITNRGTEYLFSEMAKCSTLFLIRHSTGTSRAPWKYGLVEAQNKNIGTHPIMFLQDTPEKFRSTFLCLCSKTQISPHMLFSTYELVFHMQLRIPLNFQLNLSRSSIGE